MGGLSTVVVVVDDVVVVIVVLPLYFRHCLPRRRCLVSGRPCSPSDLDRCAVDWPCRNLAATLTGPFVRLQLGTARSRILTRRPSLAALVNENVAHEEGPAGD